MILVTAQFGEIEIERDLRMTLADRAAQRRQLIQSAGDCRRCAGEGGTRLGKNLVITVQVRQRLEHARHYLVTHHAIDQCIESGILFTLDGSEQLTLVLVIHAGFGDQGTIDADMAQCQVQFTGTGLLETGQCQMQDLVVGLEAGVTEELSTDLHRAATALVLVRLGAQHVGAVAQTYRAFAVQGVSIHARHLRGDVGAGAHHATGHLVGQLEGLQIKLGAGAGQQRIEKFDGRRQHQVIAEAMIEVEQRAAQRLHTGCLRGQYLIHAIREEPAICDGHCAILREIYDKG